MSSASTQPPILIETDSASAGHVVIELRAEGDGPPIEIRVRHALKLLLRSCGLRCRQVLAMTEEIPDQDRPVVGYGDAPEGSNTRCMVMASEIQTVQRIKETQRIGGKLSLRNSETGSPKPAEQAISGQAGIGSKGVS